MLFKLKKPASNQHALLPRILPALGFIFAFLILLFICHESAFTSLPPTEKRYLTAKASIAKLKDNNQKNNQREPWEKLAQEFQSIYDSDPNWPNRPAALFKCGETLEALAQRSYSKADTRRAINCYETLALRHASSRLADDALYRAAKLRGANLRDEKGALILLDRLKNQYPKGDMYDEAIALEKVLKAALKGQAAPEAIKAPPAAQKNIVTAGDKKQPEANLPVRYKAAMAQMEKLKNDKLRACWRQPWDNLRNEFLVINKSSKNQLAAQSLYQAAICQEVIAQCSRISTDNKQSIGLFTAVAKTYPKSPYADDALLKAAKLQRKIGKSAANATLDTLIINYPKSDVIKEAKNLKAQWQEEDTGVLANASKTTAKSYKNAVNLDKPELQVLSWDSPNKSRVEIILEMSAPVKFSTRLAKASKGKPAQLFVDLKNATVIEDVRKGVKVQGSLLQGIKVNALKSGGSTLQFDFRDVKDYQARTEDNQARIILSVASTKMDSASPKTVNAKNKTGKTDKNNLIASTKTINMASQLGLTVKRVFIDAGHGGKDPGTSHNQIIERNITLDIAKRLGQLLKANGLEVVYSRLNDKTIPLSQRTKLANNGDTDLFVSIHVNANNNTEINGFETYFLNLASNKQAALVATLENSSSDKRLGEMQGMLTKIMLNAKIDESKRLAEDIQRLTMFRMKKREFNVKNNGIKSAPFHVLIGAEMPAVLIEVGYCTNRTEAKNLAMPKYRHALAEGLAEGILAYRDRLSLNHATRAAAGN